MVLSTEWSQVEVIDLINDGSGLGFGIVGGRSTGVVIKSILPGGIADRDSRLQSGDHILQIGDVNLRGLGSDQVASVLRQAGQQVRMVVARPVESTSINFHNSSAPVVPTKILTDPEELDRQLYRNGYPQLCRHEQNEISYENNSYNHQVNNIDLNVINVLNSIDTNTINVNSATVTPSSEKQILITPADIELALPETERYVVELQKNEYGLGITIAGYVCEREDLSGIFVKSISDGSEAYKCGKIQINDRIIEVDGQTLQELSNYQAVEKLKQSGSLVNLTFERYLRGPKYEHLQEAIASQETRDLSPQPSVTTLSWIPIDTEVNNK